MAAAKTRSGKASAVRRATAPKKVKKIVSKEPVTPLPRKGESYSYYCRSATADWSAQYLKSCQRTRCPLDSTRRTNRRLWYSIILTSCGLCCVSFSFCAGIALAHGLRSEMVASLLELLGLVLPKIKILDLARRLCEQQAGELNDGT
jgi:hypothetical protein